jgi:formate dehydrogenase major subunit
VLASARATNEDNYVLQKLARVVLHTNNVDGCARVCHAPSAAALGDVFGTGAATNSFDDIEHAATILVCGANPTENHPVVGARIKQAARRGAALVVVDPRRIELAGLADVHLRPRPGTNVVVLEAMAAAIVEEGLVDADFVRDRVDGLEGFVRHLQDRRPETVAGVCGVAAADIRAAARLYATRRPAMSVHGLGVTEHRQGTDGVRCLANLALLTGNVGVRGGGVNPLRGQNNVQGCAHMGCTPDRLPGYAAQSDAARFEALWGARLPTTEGLDAMQILDAAARGDIGALWVVGWDILQTQPDMHVTAAALGNVEHVIVQDLFLNETARSCGTVFLPACSAFEKDGTFMNGERRVQRVRAAVDPVGESRPDWDIACRVARALGHEDGFGYADAEEIWDEIRACWPAGAGMTYARLEEPGGLQWPCPTEDHPGTEVLHVTDFGGRAARAVLRPVELVPPAEVPDARFPLVLSTGRTLEHFNAGTMTRRSLALRDPTDVLDVSPADAEALGLRAGEPVRVVSRYGSATLEVRITDRMLPGQVFTTFSDPGVAVNRLTGPHRDTVTNTPEYKVTAVRLEAAGPGTGT